MYLYYLIGWRLDACRQKTADKKMIEKQKAFILALDGDVDFDPPAFELVLDRCLRNDKGKGSTDLNNLSIVTLLTVVLASLTKWLHVVVKFIQLEVVILLLIKILNMLLVTGFKKPLNMFLDVSCVHPDVFR